MLNQSLPRLRGFGLIVRHVRLVRQVDYALSTGENCTDLFVAMRDFGTTYQVRWANGRQRARFQPARRIHITSRRPQDGALRMSVMVNCSIGEFAGPDPRSVDLLRGSDQGGVVLGHLVHLADGG